MGRGSGNRSEFAKNEQENGEGGGADTLTQKWKYTDVIKSRPLTHSHTYTPWYIHTHTHTHTHVLSSWAVAEQLKLVRVVGCIVCFSSHRTQKARKHDTHKHNINKKKRRRNGQATKSKKKNKNKRRAARAGTPNWNVALIQQILYKMLHVQTMYNYYITWARLVQQRGEVGGSGGGACGRGWWQEEKEMRQRIKKPKVKKKTERWTRFGGGGR